MKAKVGSGRGGRQRAAKPGGVRIIGGRWRRRRLALPSGTSVRPTPDRVRETLFNWLAAELPGKGCLDLFAGSGALGFEALSRGARRVVMVEQDAALAAALAAHCVALGAGADEAQIVRADAARFVREARDWSYDVVFLDPPYDRPVAPLLAELGGVLAPGTLIYVERAVEEGLPEVERFEWHRQARAGSVRYGLARLDHAPRRRQ